MSVNAKDIRKALRALPRQSKKESNARLLRINMDAKVRLSDVRDGMDMQSDEMTTYVHRPTGRVITVSDEAMRAAEDGDEDDVEPEELAEARGILARESDYLPLPDRFEIDEYRMMERFAAGISDPSARDEVLDMLRGSGAFRRFKDTVRRLGLDEEWYGYRDRAYEQAARDWCEANGLELDPSSSS
jgi:hypothetical protein